MSSGLKAQKALQPERMMYFIETLSAVILVNSNFLKKKKNTSQIIRCGHGHGPIRLLTVPNFSVRLFGRSACCNLQPSWFQMYPEGGRLGF